MNHTRNIKEMLTIPAGNRNVATSGYSSFTDSQYFFGSQFWPENSQSMSQDVSLSSRNSQQSSEGSEPKFANIYQAKPLLFGELKDKSKTFGILDKFEEDKKRAKEKFESNILAKECHNFREALNNIQQLVSGTERNTAVCQTVLEKFDNFVSTLQKNINGLQSDIAQQFETLLNKVNSQNEVMTELEERVQKSGEATAEIGSNLQSLKNCLECLREDQKKERLMVDEALKLLNTLANEHSAKPTLGRAIDFATQTSPELNQPFSNILSGNKLEDTPPTCVSHNLEHIQAEVPPQDPSCVIGRRKFTLRGHRRKKRPLVMSQRSKHTVRDENRQPLMNCDKQQNVSQLNTVTSQKRSIVGGSFITPFSCWSQDSNSSVCFPGAEPILEKRSAESRTVTPAKSEGLWQLFDLDSDSVLGF